VRRASVRDWRLCGPGCRDEDNRGACRSTSGEASVNEQTREESVRTKASQA
jgi:hypothetical protein